MATTEITNRTNRDRKKEQKNDATEKLIKIKEELTRCREADIKCTKYSVWTLNGNGEPVKKG